MLSPLGLIKLLGVLDARCVTALYIAEMAHYISRSCPRCGDYFGIALIHPYPECKNLPIDGYCPTCQYRVKWTLVFGNNRHRKYFSFAIASDKPQDA